MKRYLFFLFFIISFGSIHHIDGNVTDQSKRALITGGAGFLGSHLCDRLISEGYEVVCVDNLLTGNIKNIQHHLNNPNFQFVDENVCTFSYSGDKIDEIYHLACPASPPLYQNDPVQTLKTNFIGTMNMLDIAKEHQAKFLQASTSEVYGDPLMHPQKESYWGNVNPIGPRACYDEGKRVAETLCFEYHRNYEVAIKVVRIFNTYGPRMAHDDGRVVSNFITQSLCGKAITVFGDGSQTRSFCYVDDLIEGFRRFMQTEDSFTGPVNLGNPHELTVLELAEMIVAKTKSTSEILHKGLPVDDPTRRNPDIFLARKILGWSPQVTLEEGLSRTIQYFRETLRLEQR